MFAIGSAKTKQGKILGAESTGLSPILFKYPQCGTNHLKCIELELP